MHQVTNKDGGIMNIKQRLLLVTLLCSAAILMSASGVFADDISSSNNCLYNTGFIHHGYYLSDKDNSSSTPFSWMPTFHLGTAHKVLGYSALASGLTAIGTGIKMTRDYSNNKKPSSRVKSLHSMAAAGAAGFTITAFTTGVLSYASMLDFGDGFSSYNNHAMLGTLATIGFIASSATAPDGGGNGNSLLGKKDYNSHCRIAEVSGGIMLSAVIVIQF
jgi:hypothetical protein